MSTLKIAIQKGGRLNQNSLQLLKDCGISIENGKDQLKVRTSNFPLEIFFLRNSDIPQYLEDGVVDIAIIGENVIIEKRAKVDIIEKLGFGKCRLSLAIPKDQVADDLSFYNKKRIATSYPNTLQDFLDNNNLNADIHSISGSVEIAPNIGLADAVCDIVSTGSTLFKNGLKETVAILKSEAVLAKNIQLSPDKTKILDKLIFRIQTVNRSKKYKYILMNVPDQQIEAVTKILPVLKSPTILPLAEKGWSSLHSVILENEFWDVIESLKEAGAQDILIIPINKMVA